MAARAWRRFAHPRVPCPAALRPGRPLRAWSSRRAGARARRQLVQQALAAMAVPLGGDRWTGRYARARARRLAAALAPIAPIVVAAPPFVPAAIAVEPALPGEAPPPGGEPSPMPATPRIRPSPCSPGSAPTRSSRRRSACTDDRAAVDRDRSRVRLRHDPDREAVAAGGGGFGSVTVRAPARESEPRRASTGAPSPGALQRDEVEAGGGAAEMDARRATTVERRSGKASCSGASTATASRVPPGRRGSAPGSVVGRRRRSWARGRRRRGAWARSSRVRSPAVVLWAAETACSDRREARLRRAVGVEEARLRARRRAVDEPSEEHRDHGRPAGDGLQRGGVRRRLRRLVEPGRADVRRRVEAELPGRDRRLGRDAVDDQRQRGPRLPAGGEAGARAR